MLKPGAIVDGRFALVRRLGAGGAGTVWLAQDSESAGREVALKVLHPRLAESPHARKPSPASANCTGSSRKR